MVKIDTGTSQQGRAVEAPRTPDEATLDLDVAVDNPRLKQAAGHVREKLQKVIASLWRAS